MEMHQVRYFLAVAGTLNFTRAADECNVAQPSLTRAIKLLEDELDGALFRRERPRAILTPLGERMLPLLQQCFDSAQSARTLAQTIKAGQAGTLKLAIANGIDLRLILPHIKALTRTVRDLDFRILRGPASEITERMKSGDAELAVGDLGGGCWERLEAWTLFEEPYRMVCSRTHRLANRTRVTVGDLGTERILMRAHDCAAGTPDLPGGTVLRPPFDVASDDDLLALVEAEMGLALLPASAALPQTLVSTAIDEFALARTVNLYGVRGRQRSPLAAAFVRMLRAAAWPATA